MMNEQFIFEISRKELNVLKEFLKVLKEERDAIISFSLEGIIRENNKKEEILKKIEYLETEKNRLLGDVPNRDQLMKGSGWTSLAADLNHTMKEINIALGKNMKLLSFSMDHVRSSIENIVQFVNQTTYKKADKRAITSFLISKEV